MLFGDFAVRMLLTGITCAVMKLAFRFLRHCACPVLYSGQAYHKEKLFKLFLDKSLGLYGLMSNTVFVFLSIHIYVTESLRVIRKYKLIPLSEAKPEMNHSLVEIFKSKRPDKNVIFWNVDDAYSQNPFAFGTVRNLNIAVPISYREYWNTHPDEAQSILEHEFAHLLNGDTWKQSLSKAFIVIVIFGTLIYWLSDTRDDYWYAVDPTGAEQI